MSERYVVGADVGTSSTRVLVFDSGGRVIGEGRGAYEVLRPKPGWAEQEADWWWLAFQQASREAMAQSGVKPEQVEAVGITHQRQSIVPLDREMRPIRPAILWNDMRCGPQAEWTNEHVGAQKVYARTGFPPATWSLYKVMWLRDNEPQTYERIHKLLLASDYVAYHLTGEVAIAAGSASATGALDIERADRWATDILEACGVPLHIWPERILQGGETVGRVTPAAAQATGLRPGTPVVATSGDQPCGCLGAGINRFGVAGINGGTSCTVEVYSEALPIDPKRSYFIEVSPMGGYFPESAIYSGASALMIWYRDNFGHEEVRAARESGENVWSKIYGLAAELPAGNTGLMLIPYFAGASGPYWDLRARGIMFGFLEAHGRPHFVRAVMEGQAYESRRIIELIEQGTGRKVTELRMYGGSAVSDLWNQMFADVLNIPVCTTHSAETTSLGAAICAARGAGIYDTVGEAVGQMVQVKDTYEPVPDNVAVYEDLFSRVYRHFYDRVQDLVHEVSVITKLP